MFDESNKVVFISLLVTFFLNPYEKYPVSLDFKNSLKYRFANKVHPDKVRIREIMKNSSNYFELSSIFKKH